MTLTSISTTPQKENASQSALTPSQIFLENSTEDDPEGEPDTVFAADDNDPLGDPNFPELHDALDVDDNHPHGTPYNSEVDADGDPPQSLCIVNILNGNAKSSGKSNRKSKQKWKVKETPKAKAPSEIDMKASFEVRPSSALTRVTGTSIGNGLFSLIPVRANVVLGYFTNDGQWISEEEKNKRIADRSAKGRYMLQDYYSPKQYYDCYKVRNNCLMSMVNSSSGLVYAGGRQRGRPVRPNSRLACTNNDLKRFYLVSTRPIHSDDEVFFSYIPLDCRRGLSERNFYIATPPNLHNYVAKRFVTRLTYEMPKNRSIVVKWGGMNAYPLHYQRWADAIPGPPWNDNKCAFDSLIFALLISQISLNDHFLMSSSNRGNIMIMEMELHSVFHLNKMFLDGLLSNIELKREYLHLWRNLQSESWQM